MTTDVAPYDLTCPADFAPVGNPDSLRVGSRSSKHELIDGAEALTRNRAGKISRHLANGGEAIGHDIYASAVRNYHQLLADIDAFVAANRRKLGAADADRLLADLRHFAEPTDERAATPNPFHKGQAVQLRDGRVGRVAFTNVRDGLRFVAVKLHRVCPEGHPIHGKSWHEQGNAREDFVTPVDDSLVVSYPAAVDY